VIVSTPQL